MSALGLLWIRSCGSTPLFLIWTTVPTPRSHIGVPTGRRWPRCCRLFIFESGADDLGLASSHRVTVVRPEVTLLNSRTARVVMWLSTMPWVSANLVLRSHNRHQPKVARPWSKTARSRCGKMACLMPPMYPCRFATPPRHSDQHNSLHPCATMVCRYQRTLRQHQTNRQKRPWCRISRRVPPRRWGKYLRENLHMLAQRAARAVGHAVQVTIGRLCQAPASRPRGVDDGDRCAQ